MKRALKAAVLGVVFIVGLISFLWVTAFHAGAHGWNVETSCEGLRVSWNDFGDTPSEITVTISSDSPTVDSTTTFSAVGNGSRVFLWSPFENHEWSVSTDNPDVTPNPWTGTQQACQTATTEATTSTTSVPTTGPATTVELSTTTSSTVPGSTTTSSTTSSTAPSTTTTSPPTTSGPSSTTTLPPTTLPPLLPPTGLSADAVAALALLGAAMLLVGGTMIWRAKR